MNYKNVTVIVTAVGRCESEGSKVKLQERMTQFLDKKNKEHKFYEATARL